MPMRVMLVLTMPVPALSGWAPTSKLSVDQPLRAAQLGPLGRRDTEEVILRVLNVVEERAPDARLNVDVHADDRGGHVSRRRERDHEVRPVIRVVERNGELRAALAGGLPPLPAVPLPAAPPPAVPPPAVPLPALPPLPGPPAPPPLLPPVPAVPPSAACPPASIAPAASNIPASPEPLEPPLTAGLPDAPPRTVPDVPLARRARVARYRAGPTPAGVQRSQQGRVVNATAYYRKHHCRSFRCSRRSSYRSVSHAMFLACAAEPALAEVRHVNLAAARDACIRSSFAFECSRAAKDRDMLAEITRVMFVRRSSDALKFPTSTEYSNALIGADDCPESNVAKHAPVNKKTANRRFSAGAALASVFCTLLAADLGCSSDAQPPGAGNPAGAAGASSGAARLKAALQAPEPRAAARAGRTPAQGVRAAARAVAARATAARPAPVTRASTRAAAAAECR